MVKKVWKASAFACVLFIFVYYKVKLSFNQITKSPYIWPSSDLFPYGTEYEEGGVIKYISAQTGYKDGTNYHENVNYWTVYIQNARLTDVEEYIAQLKLHGYTYFSFDESLEPSIEYVCPGEFMWIGCTKNSIINLYITKENEEKINDDTNEKFSYNLCIELLDHNIWRDSM